MKPEIKCPHCGSSLNEEIDDIWLRCIACQMEFKAEEEKDE
jgi:DNA-directed RNA polymerase subunit RPC12/RpoP